MFLEHTSPKLNGVQIRSEIFKKNKENPKSIKLSEYTILG